MDPEEALQYYFELDLQHGLAGDEVGGSSSENPDSDYREVAEHDRNVGADVNPALAPAEGLGTNIAAPPGEGLAGSVLVADPQQPPLATRGRGRVCAELALVEVAEEHAELVQVEFLGGHGADVGRGRGRGCGHGRAHEVELEDVPGWDTDDNADAVSGDSPFLFCFVWTTAPTRIVPSREFHSYIRAWLFKLFSLTK